MKHEWKSGDRCVSFLEPDVSLIFSNMRKSPKGFCASFPSADSPTSGRVDGQRDLEAGQLGAPFPQHALDSVVSVREPVRQVHVRQSEVRFGQRVRAGLEGAATGQAVRVQRLGTVLTRGDQLIQQVTCVFIATAAHFLHTRDGHPKTCHLLLQSHIQLEQERDGRWKSTDGDI